MHIGVDFSNDPIAAHTERNSEDLDFRLPLRRLLLVGKCGVRWLGDFSCDSDVRYIRGAHSLVPSRKLRSSKPGYAT